MSEEKKELGTLRGCPSCRKFTRENVTLCPYCHAPLPALHRPTAVAVFLGTETVTYTIIGVCVAIYILEFFVSQKLPGNKEQGFSLMNLGGINPNAGILLGSNMNFFIAHNHEYWRLLTACFLHGSLLHVFMNCWCLQTLGVMLEKLWGKSRFWGIFVISGIFSSAISLAWNYWYSQNFMYNSLGASGAICGLLGLAYGYGRRHPEKVSSEWRSVILRWIIIILLFGFFMTGIDNAAHIGGLISGAIFGFLFSPPGLERPTVNEERIWNSVGIISLLVVLVCFIFAGIFFFTNFSAVYDDPIFFWRKIVFAQTGLTIPSPL